MARKDHIEVISSEWHNYFPNVLCSYMNIMFAPYVTQITKKNSVINHCSLEKFRKRFNITSDILEPIEELWKDGADVIISGGKMIDFFLNKSRLESENDYDLFFTSREDIPVLEEMLDKKDYRQSVQVGYVTEYVTLDMNKFNPMHVQIVNSSFACVEAVIESFDIRACAICCDGINVYWVKGTLQDIRKKRLVMYNPRPNPKLFNRVCKYIQKGYTIDVPDLALASINFLDGVILHNSVQPRSTMILDREVQTVREARADYENLNENADNDAAWEPQAI